MTDDQPRTSGQTNTADTAAKHLAQEIRRLRKAAGLSQPQLALQVGYTRQYMSLAERVGRNLPSQELVRALDTALGAGGRLLALRDKARAEQQTRRRIMSALGPHALNEPSSGAMNDRPSEVAGDRAVSTDMPAAVLADSLARTGLEPEYELVERLDAAGRVDAELMTLLSDQTNYLRIMDRRVGGLIIGPQMTGHIDSMSALLAHAVVGRQRSALAAELSDAHALAGWLCFDLGDVAKSWQHYELSKSTAREAGSHTLLAHAMAEQSFVLTDVGRADAATALVGEARRTAQHRVPALLEAWLCAAEGEVLAMAGDKARSQQAFDEAQRLLPDGLPDPTLPYLMFDRAHLSRWQGNTLARLGDIAAIDYLRAALDGTEYSLRARATLHTDLAYAHAAAGHRDQVAIHIRQASALAESVSSRRQRKRIQSLTAQSQQM